MPVEQIVLKDPSLPQCWRWQVVVGKRAVDAGTAPSETEAYSAALRSSRAWTASQGAVLAPFPASTPAFSCFG